MRNEEIGSSLAVKGERKKEKGSGRGRGRRRQRRRERWKGRRRACGRRRGGKGREMGERLEDETGGKKV